MKSATFQYAKADSIPHACALLCEYGVDAKLLAGGQSLVPMMAMRLARPAWLINVNEIDELKTSARRSGADGEVWVTGAGVRQIDLERDEAVAAAVPLLRQGLSWVGHVQTKNRGTVGGSLVHADPSAELPLVAHTLGARCVLRRADVERSVEANAFFIAPMITATEPDECLTEVHWPIWRRERVGSAFDEVSIRHGDFAIVAACAQVELDHAGRCVRAALGIGGAASTPVALDAIARSLHGTALDPTTVDAALRSIGDHLDPASDVHATAEYRIHLARVLAARVIRQARADALSPPHRGPQ
ncbi:MAG: FAD binding domain-containing protein [Proteobacteria bacterium]|nr:FAD binding domain-containing protein [Burkholderiales bacterium]